MALTEKQLSKIYFDFRNYLPASVLEDVVRELAFIYYLYLKIYKQYSELDLDQTAHEVINALSKEEDDILSSDIADKDFALKCKHNINENQLRKIVYSGVEDWSFYTNDGNKLIDPLQITHLFGCLHEEDLLALINTSVDSSMRDDSTPESVADLVLALASRYGIKTDLVTDMACGSGSFLLKASKTFKRAEGVEININNALIAKIRFIVNQINGEIRQGDCFEDSWHHQTRGEHSDLVFSEFPWKLIVKDYGQKEIMYNCNANKLLMSPNSTTDYFFLSAMMNYLKRDGVAITVMPLSSLSNLADKKVREHIIRRGFLREVIALPNNIFGRKGVATAIVVVGLEPCEKISFFDGSEFYIKDTRKTNSIDVKNLLSALDAAKRNGSCYVSKDSLKEHDYSFSPSHYLNPVQTTIPNATDLIDLADIFTGWQVTSAKLEEIHKTDETGIRLLQMSNVENGNIVSKLERYDIPANTIERFKVQHGDVVISTKSLRVKSAVVDLDVEEPIVAAGSIMVIRPKPDLLDPYYLVAFFESDLGKQVLEMYQTGNIIPNLSINNVKKIPIPRLSFGEQRKIGIEYRDLRDLIASEKERLRTLEKKANKILDHLWDDKGGE